MYKSFSLESLLLDTLSMMQWFAVCFSILQCHNCYVVFTLVNSQATLFDSMFQFKVAMFFQCVAAWRVAKLYTFVAGLMIMMMALN